MHHFRAAAILAVSISSVVAQNCISLADSTACPAFNAASISTSDLLLQTYYPFLASVSNVQDFDSQLSQYVTQGYVISQYSQRYGCDNVNANNLTDYYARYTTTFLCNVMVQITLNNNECGLTAQEATPMCTSSCSDFALSEGEILNSTTTCSGKVADWLDLLRADSTDCALPPDSLINATCVTGAQNEPANCGFGSNLLGLCNYCRGASGVNNTDSCCIASDTETRCDGVSLIYTPISGLLSSSTSSTGPSTSGTSSPGSSPTSPSNSRHGLSGGAIAGIVIGSVVGFLLLLGLIIFACIAYRRRRDNDSSVASLNQPSPPRQIGSGGSMVQRPISAPNQNFTILPGNGRVTRLSAMQSEEGSNEGGYKGENPYGQTPGGQAQLPGVLGPIRMSPRSNGSSGGSKDFSSPDGVGSGQSEQLPFFKDYYSNGEIHPNDRVSVLWAYQPRAGDEFELERGDMLKVVGIWDDGWATGVRISDRAEDYDGKGKSNRDSGVSNGSGRRSESPPIGEIKAFPLVCVCLPEVWRKTVEGDSSTDSGSVPI